MSTPLFNIGGIASGIDTNSMLEQLLQLERQPIRKIQARQAQLQRADDAWGQVNTKLSGLRAAITDLDRLDDFTDAWTATSSSTAVAGARVTGTPSAGSMSFSVGRLATAKQQSSATAYATTDTLVGTGTVTVDVGGTQTTIDTTGLTVADLAARIEELAGIRAQTVSANDGYHLVLTSEQTGTANAFTVTSAAGGGGALIDWNPEVAAADAEITIAGMTLTRSTNTVDDLVDGVTLDLVGTGSTTVATARDVDGVAAKVSGLVDALNGVLKTVEDLSAYDPDSRTTQPLAGEAAARSLASSLRSAVSDIVSGITGDHTYAGSIGISLTRHGAVELDETVLKDALAADFEGVTGLLARGGSASDVAVSYVYASDATVAGTYALDVTTAAATARITGDPWTTPDMDETFRLTADDGTTVDVTIAAGTSLTDAVTQIAAELEAAGVTTVGVDGDTGALRFTEARYGSAYDITVEHLSSVGTGTSRPGLFGVATTGTPVTASGADVAGTIGGEAAVGKGRHLTGSAGDPDGLQIRVGGTTTGARGTVTVTEGIVGRLSRVLSRFEGSDGVVELERDRIGSQLDLFDDRIEAHERRVSLREQTLRRQFTAMETALATLQSQGNWLSQQLSSLNAQNKA